jgi:Peptidase_C39 like family
VLTDLFAVVHGIEAAAVAAAVPPGCGRGVAAAPPVTRDGGDAVVELGPWRPRHPARHLVPALSALDGGAGRFRFEASVRTAGGWSSWVATATVGGAEFAPMPGNPGGLRAHVDLWQAAPPAEEIRLRVRCAEAEPLRGRWLATLSASDLAPGAGAAQPGAVRLAVPAVSQMAAGGAIGGRICSPASVAMVLAYWGRGAGVRSLAAEMLHAALDLYGVWPAAIDAAARRGVVGYLLRFPDWAAAAWCLARGIPVVASVRYAAGELAGAAVSATPGHLLVLTGYENGTVLANDPAASAAARVSRRYALADLTRVWLERNGVGYVLFDPQGAASARGRAPRRRSPPGRAR